MEIGTEWIQIAIENGGFMDLQRLGSEFSARMRWRTGSVVLGSLCKTVAGALNALDTALAEDAANEMIEKGVV